MTPGPAPAGARLDRRRFLGLGALALSGAATAAMVDARWFELHHLEVVRRPLRLRGLPDALAGKTLVQLSDLHVGPRVDDDYVIRTFEQVRTFDPDLVVFTGDFITNGRTTFEQAARVYDHAPHGKIATLGVLGNHDYGKRWSHPEIAARVVELVTRRGIEVIRNDVREVAGLQFAGFDDLWAHRFDAAPVVAKVDPARALLVLTHNPDTVDLAAMRPLGGGFLAGHTHGGQVRIPPFPPPILPVLNHRYAAGAIALGGGRELYVSRGVGHLIPVRFGVRPEVTVFTLTPA